MPSMKLDNQYKICKDCQKKIDLTLFSKDKSYKDGLAVRCKPCKRNRYNPKLFEEFINFVNSVSWPKNEIR